MSEYTKEAVLTALKIIHMECDETKLQENTDARILNLAIHGVRLAKEVIYATGHRCEGCGACRREASKNGTIACYAQNDEAGDNGS